MIVRGLTLRQNPAYRPGDSRLLLALVVVAACAQPIPRQEPTPAPAPVVIAAPGPVAWRIVPSLTAREYVIEQRAIVQTTTDSGTFHDTTGISTEVSLRQTAEGGASGLLRSALLVAPGAAPSPLSGLTLPLAFSVPTVAKSVLGVPSIRTVSGAPMDPCRSPAEAALSSVRELLVRPP